MNKTNSGLEAIYYFLNAMLKRMYKTQRTSLSYTEISNIALQVEKEMKK